MYHYSEPFYSTVNRRSRPAAPLRLPRRKSPVQMVQKPAHKPPRQALGAATAKAGLLKPSKPAGKPPAKAHAPAAAAEPPKKKSMADKAAEARNWLTSSAKFKAMCTTTFDKIVSRALAPSRPRTRLASCRHLAPSSHAVGGSALHPRTQDIDKSGELDTTEVMTGVLLLYAKIVSYSPSSQPPTRMVVDEMVEDMSGSDGLINREEFEQLAVQLCGNVAGRVMVELGFSFIGAPLFATLVVTALDGNGFSTRCVQCTLAYTSTCDQLPDPF